MDELKKMICEKLGVDASKADSAIQMVVSFLKDRLPDEMKGVVDQAMNGKFEGLADQAKGMLGGLFK